MKRHLMLDKNDPASLEIAGRSARLVLGDDPDKPAHALGEITLADGHKVKAHVVHSADALVTDGEYVVMIDRRNEPAKGKPALPGGFLDPGESAEQAAAREAQEEAGIDLTHAARVARVGKRSMYRPEDVRIASNDGLYEKYGIARGDVFMVSTQALRLKP